MAKKDRIIMLNQEQLLDLQQKLLSNNPQAALNQVRRWYQQADNKIYNTHTEQTIIQLISQYYAMDPKDFTTAKDGRKHKGVQPRRMLALLLSQFTALERKDVQRVCGYTHNSSVSLALEQMTADINNYVADQQAYMDLVAQLNKLEQDEAVAAA